MLTKKRIYIYMPKHALLEILRWEQRAGRGVDD